MAANLEKMTGTYRRARVSRRRWQKFVSAVACVVVFCTVYALILPALTLDQPVYCGLEEHTHSDACEKVLTCTLAECESHVHTDSCYTETGRTLICGTAEHTHADACFDGEGNLTCTLAEHIHTDDCYLISRELTCGLEETEGHTHTDACYACPLTEHTHTEQCCSNPEADVETAEQWEETVASVELTGEYCDDLLSVAQTQLGYTESQANFKVAEDGTRQGYTRYGHWYGGMDFAYEDWCAMFVSFCLNFAGIPETAFPREASCPRWVETLQALDGYWASQEAWRTAYDFGSLVFFDYDGDGEADHVGIVSGYELDPDSDADRPPVTRITVIEGNSSDAVEENTYALPDATVLGFAYLPYEDGGVPVAAAAVVEDSVTGDLSYTSSTKFYIHQLTSAGFAAYTVGAGDAGSCLNLYESGKTAPTIAPDGSTAYSIVSNRSNNKKVMTGTVIENAGQNMTGLQWEAWSNQTNYAIWYFEVQDNTAGTYRIYKLNESDEREYLLMTVGTNTLSHLSLTSNLAKASVFTLETTGSNNQLTLSAYPTAEYHVVKDTVSPSSTLINVFDYWLVSESSSDNADPKDSNNKVITASSGINNGKTLNFRSSADGTTGNWNQYYSTGYSGIVKAALGSDGYPVLNVGGGESLEYLFNPTSTDPVTAYRRTIANAQGLLSQDADGYFVYNCTDNYACLKKDKEGNYTNEFVVYDKPYVGNGQFFPFNSLVDLLAGDITNQQNEAINHYFGVSLTSRFIQNRNGHADADHTKPTTFEFSGDDDVWIFIDDILVADLGGIHDACSVKIDFALGTVTINNGTPVSFGDIFPPDALTDIDSKYGTGKTLKNGTTHTLKFFYLERGNNISNMVLKYNLAEIPATSIYKVNQYGDALGGATFAVYAADSSWNYLANDASKTPVAIPQNVPDDAITYDADWNMTYNGHTFQALYYGTTNSSGEMVFVDRDNMYYSLSELEDMFGSHFILREVAVPDGYRTVSDDTCLYIEGGLLQTADPYGTGVWASPNALITATNTLHVADSSKTLAESLAQTNTHVTGNATDGYTIDYYSPGSGSNGTLFAVVLKRNGQDSGARDLNDLNLSTWYPVYGSDDKGYQVSTPGESGNLQQAIDAAKTNASAPYNQTVTFSVAASGMQLLMENLPGKPERYYSYVHDNGKTVDASEPQYVVAYYWTTETITTQADWEKVTTTNTVRVASHENTTPENDTGFDVQWGSTIQVPNVLNRLFFQKKDEAGKLVNNAVFALYNVEEHAKQFATPEDDKLIYYIGDASINSNTKYWVALLDSDGSTANAGKAAVFRERDDKTAEMVGYGTYTINTSGWQPVTTGDHAGRVAGTNIGRITVNVTHSDKDYTQELTDDKKVTVYVDPAKDVNNNSLVGYTHEICDVVTVNGTGHLSYLDEGCYYLREIAAPVGYALNATSVPVYIDSTGVYANAGAADNNNGVAVGNGVGYLVATMNTFASQGKIDESLTWVYGALIVNHAEDFSAFAADTGDTLTVFGTDWSFAKQVEGDEQSHASDVVNPSNDSSARSDAMVTYLVYTGDNQAITEDIFDYSPNGNQEARKTENSYSNFGTNGVATLPGQGTLRLYTTSGWSDLAIYQDYAYGYKQFTTGSTTNYDDLTGKGNLANLFSSSTFVEVTDKQWVDLELVKTVSGTNSTLTGAQFRLKDATGAYYHRENNETTWVKDAANATVIYPGSETQPTVFYDLPIGTFQLEEIKAPDGYNLLTQTISVTVADPTSTSGVSIVAGETDAVLSDTVKVVGWNHKAVPDDGTATGQGLHYQFTLTVPNSTGFELPATGGVGTQPYTWIGAALSLFALSALLYSKSPRGKRKGGDE